MKLRYLLILLIFSCSPDGTPIDYQENPLSELRSDISAGIYGDIHSLIVEEGGATVVEWYFNGYDRDTPHDTHSVSKGITSAIVGIAWDRGEIDLDDEYQGGIKVSDFMSMQSGINWNKGPSPPGRIYDLGTNEMIDSGDWIGYISGLESYADPGTQFRYSNGDATMISAIMKEATGIDLDIYASIHLFEPLGITEWEWEKSQAGVVATAWGLSMTPLSMLKVGRMYLDGGSYRGNQVVSTEWVDLSTSKFARVNSANDFGLLWWIPARSPTFEGLDAFYTVGYLGQFIIVVPTLDMVIVSTANNEEATRIFPALKDYFL